jgi:hypothetical protein
MSKFFTPIRNHPVCTTLLFRAEKKTLIRNKRNFNGGAKNVFH